MLGAPLGMEAGGGIDTIYFTRFVMQRIWRVIRIDNYNSQDSLQKQKIKLNEFQAPAFTALGCFFALWPNTVQPDKTAIVIFSQFTHQCCKSNCVDGYTSLHK
jgi:hypothetical protein